MPNDLDQITQERLETDPDFILIRRFDYSLKRLVERYPEGAPDRIIAQALGIEEHEVQEIYRGIVLKLKSLLSPTR
jgi:hypothetical protein